MATPLQLLSCRPVPTVSTQCPSRTISKIVMYTNTIISYTFGKPGHNAMPCLFSRKTRTRDTSVRNWQDNRRCCVPPDLNVFGYPPRQHAAYKVFETRRIQLFKRRDALKIGARISSQSLIVRFRFFLLDAVSTHDPGKSYPPISFIYYERR